MPLVCFEDNTKLARIIRLFVEKYVISGLNISESTTTYARIEYLQSSRTAIKKKIIHSCQLGNNWDLPDISHSRVLNKGRGEGPRFRAVVCCWGGKL